MFDFDGEPVDLSYELRSTQLVLVSIGRNLFDLAVQLAILFLHKLLFGC